MEPFVSDFFTEHVFRVHPYYGMYQYFIHFYCQIVFRCVDIPLFVYLFIGWWTLGFLTLWLLQLCAFFGWTCVSFLSEVYLGMEFLPPMLALCLTF